MKPIFRVIADSVDITAKIQQRLISISTTDEAGIKSDTCTITLDDRDGIMQIPRKGAKLMVSLGYEETGLSTIGIYTVDEVSLSGFPQTMSISAKAADFTDDIKGDIKSPITRHFDNVTFDDLVKTISGEHDLIGKVAAELASVMFTHIDQTQESNIHLLTRLAQQHNGIAKVTHDALILAKAGASMSMSGLNLSSVVINKNQVSDYHCSLTDRAKYKAVTATWHNKLTGQNIAVSTSEEKPAFMLRHTYDDEQKAIEAARAKLEDLTQGTNTVDVTLDGNPNLFAESPLVLMGFRPGVSGTTWTVTRVEHTLTTKGFKTTVAGEAK